MKTFFFNKVFKKSLTNPSILKDEDEPTPKLHHSDKETLNKPPLKHKPPPPPSIRPPAFHPSTKTPPKPTQASEKRSDEPSIKPLPRPKGGFGIAIKLGASADQIKSETSKKKSPSNKVAAVFNAEDSSDEEEMPAEAKMRMRNVGRETITSSGPNSFGKTKRGFTDSNKLFERQLKEAMDKVSSDP